LWLVKNRPGREEVVEPRPDLAAAAAVSETPDDDPEDTDAGPDSAGDEKATEDDSLPGESGRTGQL
jgi:hypothetical protein